MSQYLVQGKCTSDYFLSSNKIDKTKKNRLISDSGYINNKRYYVYIIWDPEKGLVLKSRYIPENIISANGLNKNALNEDYNKILVIKYNAIADRANRFN